MRRLNMPREFYIPKGAVKVADKQTDAAVPHLFGKGLQWSPADDLLIAGEFARETSIDALIRISGSCFNSSHRQESEPAARSAQ